MSDQGRERVAAREVANALKIRPPHALRLIRTARSAARHELRGENLISACRELLKKEKS